MSLSCLPCCPCHARQVVSTYQAASGAGAAAMRELELQTREVLEGKPVTKNIFPLQARRSRTPIPP